MSDLIFPTLRGMDSALTKTPTHNTLRVKSPLTGYEVRGKLRAYPLYAFKLTFNYLLDKLNDKNSDLKTLMGFYNRVGGSFDNFLLQDPDDNTVTNQVIGIGDGTTNVFHLVKTMGEYTEPVYGVIPNDIEIYINSVRTTLVTVNTHGTVSFGSGQVPHMDDVISWSGPFYYRVIFDEDSNDFERLFRGVWDLKDLKFLTDRG